MLLAVNSFPKGTVVVIGNPVMRRHQSSVARFGSSLFMSAETASNWWILLVTSKLIPTSNNAVIRTMYH